MLDLNHSGSCGCVVCLLARAYEGATEEQDAQSQRDMSARWHGFADQVEKELESNA